ncbi:hypothetical protein M885DRAFT_473012 [Pelagophyceae sp. CCMP2097]|nr:hypothetical protein M885DRAFT_473012 [Pelagophyceae sp. CCMP2097]
MWSYSFTSSRSLFVGTARIGFHVQTPEASGASEASIAEALRLALREAHLQVVLVDRGAELAVRALLHPRDLRPDFHAGPLAPTAEEKAAEAEKVAVLMAARSPPARASLLLLARLGNDCHRSPDAAVQQARQTIKALGVEFLDGLTVPWPPKQRFTDDDEEHKPGWKDPDPGHVSPEVKRQKKVFLRTWAALQALVADGSVQWLGTEGLAPWQLERCVEAWNGENLPKFNLLSVSVTRPMRRTVNWCQSRGIEVLALLDTTAAPLETDEEKAIFQKVHASLAGVDAASIVTSWALQCGVVAFPSLAHALAEAAEMATVEEYEKWLGRMRALLGRTTLALRSPTEARRVHLDANALAVLEALDRDEAGTRARLEALLDSGQSGLLDSGLGAAPPVALPTPSPADASDDAARPAAPAAR